MTTAERIAASLLTDAKIVTGLLVVALVALLIEAVIPPAVPIPIVLLTMVACLALLGYAGGTWYAYCDARHEIALDAKIDDQP